MAAEASTDQKILDLIKKVTSERKEIAKILGKPSYSTNGSFSYSEGRSNDSINIRVEKDVRTLISIGSFVRSREGVYAETAAILGVVDPPAFTWGGFTVEEWLNDLKVAISKSQVAARQKKLAELEARLNSIVSPELRARLEIEAIESELN